MRWLKDHADVLAILVMAVVMTFGVYQLGEQQDDRRAEVDVAACTRGNVIRDYLAFDNAEAVLVLRSSLQGAQRDLRAKEQKAREESLARRIEAQKQLTPFDCQTLR